MLFGNLDGVHHLRLRLTDADAAHGVAVEIHLEGPLSTLHPEGGIGSSLHDPELTLPGSRVGMSEKGTSSTGSPCSGPLHRRAQDLLRCR